MAAEGRPSADDRPVRVRVLGGFAVEGYEERALGTRKARLLLKRLAAAQGRAVAADELANVLWGEELPANPSDQISVLVSRLRGVLGAERLLRSDAGYCLAADSFDLADLERSTAQTEERLRSGEKAAALASAHVVLGLAAGGLLPEEDGAWLDELRPAAARLVARARLVAAEAAANAGEFGAARAAAQSVLDDDPYDEAALRLVMRADALAGRPGTALNSYAQARRRLAEDLGSDPAPETEQLHTAIVRGELRPAPQNPAGTTDFVGRETELGLLDAVLTQARAGHAGAVVVEAEAGLGKTALVSLWLANSGAGAVVLSGRCDELGRDLPLQPIIDGLDAHLERVGRQAADDILGSATAALSGLLARDDGETPGVTTVGDAETSRAALFSALVAVLRRATGSRTLILAIDDLHLAAAGTAEFLAFALRRIPELMVIVTRRPDPGPDLPTAQRIPLGPLSAADVVAMVGAERGPALYERSGGHPLFVRELSAAEGAQLPESIVAAVRNQLQRLGPASTSLEAAAACGTEADAALVAAITGREIAVVLDDFEAATRARVLRPRGAALAFSHELVRVVIESATSPARKTEIHRSAVHELARRRDTDPLALARHARLGGETAVAAAALVTAAERAKQRYELASAEELLDQAIALADSAAARMARGRLRLARLDIDAAREDGRCALDLGAGVEGFELAGWVAYYARDYDTALRYADEGVERAASDDVRASCLALAGRIRHTRGYLAEAAVRFEDGVSTAPSGIRGMLQVWHGQLLAHRGEPDKAAELARRGLLDPHVSHPFVAGHGHFTLAYALAVAGRWSDALDAVDDFDAWIARRGDKRFPPVAANARGWLLRGAGLLDQALELHGPAVDLEPGPTFQEAHYAALLDIAECHLDAGRPSEAARTLDSAAAITTWTGSMSWRHRNRYQLLGTRVTSLGGDHAGAADQARAISAAAAERGDRRYEYRGLLTAATIEARAGRRVDPSALEQIVNDYRPFSGPDGWRELGELAKATSSEVTWRYAESQAAVVVTEALRRTEFDSSRIPDAVRSQLEALKP